MDLVDLIFDASGGLINDWQDTGEKLFKTPRSQRYMYALQARPVLVWVSYGKLFKIHNATAEIVK